MADGDDWVTRGAKQVVSWGGNAVSWVEQFEPVGVINKPAPLSAYFDLDGGHNFQAMQQHGNEAPQVDGSSALARLLSPFTIQVELPLAFRSTPTVASNSAALGVYDAAVNYRAEANRTPDAVEETLVEDEEPSPLPHSVGKPHITDLKVALDIHTQVQTVKRTPPLTLLINPHSFNVVYSKVQSFDARTRYGNVFQTLGEEQVRLDMSLMAGGFVSGGRGYHVDSKQDSAAWQNIMALLKLYKNNGYIYNRVDRSHANHFVGGMSIQYDQWLYYGNMETFQYTYTPENTHGGMEIQISFVVSAMVDLSQASTVVQPIRSPDALIPTPEQRAFFQRYEL